jgi:cytochrome c oxidase assembly protein subunit 15
MGDEWFPSGGWNAAIGLANLVNNPIVVQFIHRWWAWVAAALALMLAKRAKAVWPAAPFAIATLIVLQIMLGIATLMSGVAVVIAVAHQAVAAILLAHLIRAAHAVGFEGV